MDDVISVLANAVQRIAISGTFYNAKYDIDVLVYTHYAIAVWAICAKKISRAIITGTGCRRCISEPTYAYM